jgi:Flp pilus assembly protein TadG
MRRPPNRTVPRDAGFVNAVEVVYLGIAALVAITFLGFIGRLSAAGVQVTNASQDAARSAAIARDPNEARTAADAAVQRSGLPGRCLGDPSASLSWNPSDLGTWQGGTVTVTVSCNVSNQGLTGVWTPGERTVTVSDTQVVERFRR